MTSDPLAAWCAKLLPEVLIFSKATDVERQRFRVVRRKIKRRRPEHLTVNWGVRRHDGQAVGHGFNHGMAKGFAERGEQKNIASPVKLLDLVRSERAQEVNPRGHIRPARQCQVFLVGDRPLGSFPCGVHGCFQQEVARAIPVEERHRF